jgi:hypothetical protein
MSAMFKQSTVCIVVFPMMLVIVHCVSDVNFTHINMPVMLRNIKSGLLSLSMSATFMTCGIFGVGLGDVTTLGTMVRPIRAYEIGSVQL